MGIWQLNLRIVGEMSVLLKSIQSRFGRRNGLIALCPAWFSWLWHFLWKFISKNIIIYVYSKFTVNQL